MRPRYPVRMDREPRPPLVTATDTWSYTLDGGPSHTGAQGHVFFGIRSDGTPIAVKVGGQGNAEQALLNEIGSLRALAAAGVQGVVPVWDVVDVNGRAGMVMPRYRSTLADWLDRVIEAPTEGTLDEILSKVATLARILASVHAVSWGGDTLLHRDVKPENVFMDEDERLVLGDFGGAMAITGLTAVELALFGSPLYAPLDQILPGRAIPDPTWDTYALCVILYTALTGARPAYQSDPRGLLTPMGQSVWQLAQRAIDATGPEAQRLRVDFAHARVGTTAHDLVHPVGKSALNRYDQELLEERISALASLRQLPDDRLRSLQRNVWRVLTRGLSPLSHPSPPNRFRDAAELAELLEELRDQVHPPSPVTAPPPVSRPDPIDAAARPDPRDRRGMRGILTLTLGSTVVLFAAAGAALLVRYPPQTWFVDSQQAEIPARQVQVMETHPPSDVTSVGNRPIRAMLTASSAPASITKVGVRLMAPARDLAIVASNAMGQPVARVELGPHPKGDFLQAWTPPPGPITFQVIVDPPSTEAVVLVEGTPTSDGSGVTLGGEAVEASKIVQWTRTEDVAPFSVDRTEVTEERWAACAEAGQCPARPDARAALPVVGVGADDAAAFCEYAGGALPTEAQWRAAHGPGRYPWGDAKPTCRHAHGHGCAESPQRVGLLVEGSTPEGVMDLAGNAWEWASTPNGPAVLLGGGVDTRGARIGGGARMTARGIVSWAGLRCVYPPASN
ncbi:MAG: SUMF1/EgtB/PvdO family nonheme iron enzyme [Myxococcota bacterium]